jgi:integrase
MSATDTTDTTEKPVKPEKAAKKARREVKSSPGLLRRTFKKPDGSTYEGDIWYIRYSAPDPQNPGKMRKVFTSTGTANKTEAQALLTKRKASVIEERHPELRRTNETTFKAFVLDHYIEHCKDQAGIKDKKTVCNALIRTFGRYELRDITAKMLADYRRGKEAAGCKPATCNRHLATIKTIFEVASSPEFNLVSTAKVLELRSIKNKPEGGGRLNYLTKPQVKALLTAAEPWPYLHQITRFAVNTGIRRGRIFKLTWDMLDIENNFLHFPIDKHGDRYDAPLNNEVMKVLEERKADKKEGMAYVFFNPDTDDCWKDLKEIWATVTGKAGLIDFHFHDCRHTFISHLVMSGVDIRTVQQLAGHKTLAMTMRYAHLSPEHKMRAIDMLSYDEATPAPTHATPDTPERPQA